MSHPCLLSFCLAPFLLFRLAPLLSLCEIWTMNLDPISGLIVSCLSPALCVLPPLLATATCSASKAYLHTSNQTDKAWELWWFSSQHTGRVFPSHFRSLLLSLQSARSISISISLALSLSFYISISLCIHIYICRRAYTYYIYIYLSLSLSRLFQVVAGVGVSSFWTGRLVTWTVEGLCNLFLRHWGLSCPGVLRMDQWRHFKPSLGYALSYDRRMGQVSNWRSQKDFSECWGTWQRVFQKAQNHRLLRSCLGVRICT